MPESMSTENKGERSHILDVENHKVFIDLWLFLLFVGAEVIPTMIHE